MTNPTNRQRTLQAREAHVLLLVAKAVEILGTLALKSRKRPRLQNTDIMAMYDALFSVLEELNDENYDTSLEDEKGGG